MSRTIGRWTMAGALALGALGTIGGFTPGVATAHAEPSVSPFAGIWSGTFDVTASDDPDFHRTGTFDWRISDAGRITGTYFRTTGSVGGPFWFSGHVRDDGELMVVMHNEGGGVPHEGSAAIDDDGNLVASVTDAFSPRSHTWSLVAVPAGD